MPFEEKAANQTPPKPKKKSKYYYFLPANWQRQNTIAWIKKVHAWTGLWGALIFIMLGVSGFFLNHRSVLKIDTGGNVEVANITMVAENGPFSTREDYARWLEGEFNISKLPLPERKREQTVSFNGKPVTEAEEWRVRYNGPNAFITSTYTPSTNQLTLSKQDKNFLAFIKNLHKGSGLTAAWILFIDAIAGAFLFMSITGILLWSKLHGTRLVAGLIFFSSTILAILTALPGILFSAL
ncbi:PepSY-associated TM helix domain-containing protein [Kordiimonas sp. SCSIO 12610]|uniref:PepSY-associated TM helix domain-containing protein n=1 Tax=Kordiimonas sp. SCSIO 12610 TaxID=2829597 RepID=UPI00210E41D7|nr:PepSY-associated TM helix domain-containing protein [Kordiimonas sp. SCSIO 12610]UTW56563.1 PepSY-associated TM helix domain-containing protein [Kordiimonas sp. SCSIO 12610]